MGIGDILGGKVTDIMDGKVGEVLKGKVVDGIATNIATGVARSLLPQVSAMMAYGLFIFGLHTVPYQQFQRQTQWRHPSSSRIGKRPARQFIGPGDDTITLSGTLYPEITGGKISLSLLRAMADSGKSWPLIDGSGTAYGFFVIEDLSETGTIFFSDGSARKIDFSLKLTHTDDVALVGSMLDKNLLGTLDQSLRGLIDSSLGALR
ncbi:MAG: phage tail protein [Sterolibacterium sp.]|nr:phage tail protein [Sterolibacterium sp.]